MIIQEEDFRMIPCGTLWDLELAKTIRPKGGEPRVEFKSEGFC